MRRNAFVIVALVLVFALMLTACAARRPLQTPIQPRQDTTGLYNNNRGVGSGTGNAAGTRTGAGTGTGIGGGDYTGMGPTANGQDGSGYGFGNNAGYGGYNNGMYGGNANNNGYFRGGNNSPNYGLNNTAGTTVADRLANTCEMVAGVNNATCVVSGNTAYVGIDTGGGTTGRNIASGNTGDVAAIKRQCAQRIRAAYPNIKTVYVSTDANFLDRLRRVRDGIGNGNTVNNFRNELNDLIRGLTPERQ